MDIENIIHKYLSRSATEEEMQFLLQWLEEKEENRTDFKKTYDLWLYSNALLTDDADMEEALTRLKERISSDKKKKTNFSLFRLPLLRIAASILLLLSASYLGYSVRDYKEEKFISYNYLLTGANGKGEFVLPDGTTVWLNASSILKYPETFTGGKRLVHLEGEALFEVKQGKKNPFFVETDGIDVEVTGTRFLVNNYPKKNIIEAVLVNGHVALSSNYFPELWQMKPGELITYNKQTRQTTSRQVNTDDYTNWIHSKLVFDKTNLAQVIVNLQKWFDVEIEATPELLRSTHMSFTVRRESLEEVLTYMSLTASIGYRWKDDILYLYSTK